MDHKLVISAVIVAFAAVAGTSDATEVTTGGGDFHATNATDQAKLLYTITGVQNTSTSNVTVMGAVKREPTTSSDGTQTVSVDLYNPGNVHWSGTVWIYSTTFGGNDLTFTVQTGDPAGWITKTVTFPASWVQDDSYIVAVVGLAPSAYVGGAYNVN
jgi:hypothetical protein